MLELADGWGENTSMQASKKNQVASLLTSLCHDLGFLLPVTALPTLASPSPLGLAVL